MTELRPIQCLGIVNRGDAAMRCIRAVKALRARERSAMRAIVLYTDVDRDAPFVRHADTAVRLPSPEGEVRAYLDHDQVIGALARSGADAVWPGWGFVAEDPAFADRIAASGMAFLGPSGHAMRALGDKVAAKLHAERAGVPVIAWSAGVVEDEQTAVRIADRLGYPIVVKATAGGGGRGIRVVTHAAELPKALRSAGVEAHAAFGDGRLFLERKIAGARHVEVQIAADLHGHVLALGARDCSVQRRHQKIVEEAPPPGLDPASLTRLASAAVRLAEVVGYSGVGTVEFLLADDGAHYFLEMNPRLQVEHGITEEVTGLDLVELQIRIARGERLAGLDVGERGVAIEARICAEDPDSGFTPAPGRIARFDPPLGRGIRVDTGVATGTVVPAAFDSLIVKVIATGATRDEARGRLAAALRDMDLVIEGGATNTGYLIDVLESAEFRRGGVDAGWIDRRGGNAGAPGDSDASDALVAAAILAYQRRRRDARVNFFADTTHVSPVRVPPSLGQEVDLEFGGAIYRLAVFALGSWRYRVQLDGSAVRVALREGDGHLAELALADRTRRIVYDASDSGLRLELDNRPYRFGWETAGHVRAAAPAIVVGLQARPGDRVAAGQLLGFLEAMKVEIGFLAPIAGTVREIRVAKGALVAAGDVLAVVEPEVGCAADVDEGSRVTLRAEPDVFEASITDLATLDSWEPTARRDARAALRDEVRAVLLGYDVDPRRARWLAALFEATDVAALSEGIREELAAFGDEIVVFADLEQLFLTAPRVVGGVVVPSNAARLRAYVRRMHAGGAGVVEEFLGLLRAALGHYGVASLAHDDSLERALLRLFATQHAADHRGQLVGALFFLLRTLARAGTALATRPALADALDRIATMRGLVPDVLADAAIETHATIFDGTARPSEPGRCQDDVGLRLRLLRSCEPGEPITCTTVRLGSHEVERLDLRDGRVIIGVASRLVSTADTVMQTCRAIAAGDVVAGRTTVDALEIVVLDDEEAAREAAVAEVRDGLGVIGLPAARCTISFVCAAGGGVHRTLVRARDDVREDSRLLGLHPETAARIGFDRLRGFELERLPGGDDVYCFWGRSRMVPEDERLFVLAEVRGRTAVDPRDAVSHVGAFERVFHEATRALRGIRSARDPRRRLHWNRIAIAVDPAIDLERSAIHDIARRLASETRHLGLEKVLVRLRLRDREHGTVGEPVEVVASDLTGNHLEIDLRQPRTTPLQPADHYERRVVEARRRRLVYPYEIVRMRGHLNDGSAIAFEEYDLDPDTPEPRAVCVAGRPYGQNRAAVVFGIVGTPTDKFPEGLRRVLVLSDPTAEMGALAAPECDRIVAALDLAEQHGLPVEWVPISSGARIAMDSGTENLDATARVVRRIIEFTECGGIIHIVVYGVNVGAQSYWNSLATMLGRTRGALVMTPDASMVLTGRAALEASGAVAAEDEVALGGFERVMGPNGEAQYYAPDLAAAFRTLDEHYRYTYVPPGEHGPRRHRTSDSFARDVTQFPYPPDLGHGFTTVGEIFDDVANPGRKRPFAMRAVMEALVDQDGGSLERWRSWAGGETAIVWDAHLGGIPISLIGIESENLPREGHRPLDGPPAWSGGTLFPRSSKKVARALDAASGNRPVVILANLSGFDGSPESLRKLQLEYGAEIARAVVRFEGPLFFVIVSRYHGGAYVVFSKSLNPRLRVLALTGSYASVIGGSAAAAVVFSREVRARAAADPIVHRAREAMHREPHGAKRASYERALDEATRTAQADVAREFDAIHTVERARRVGSIDAVIEPEALRPAVIRELHAGGRPSTDVARAPAHVGESALGLEVGQAARSRPVRSTTRRAHDAADEHEIR
jgi:acetyl/propionyl-CoA carboxylase alpha subunit/acetyl-CoA carboxylase carboxyltransferase component